MNGLFTFKFWGVHENGDRDLLGMVNAIGMCVALELIHRRDLLPPHEEYHRIEIENAGRAP